MKHNKMSLKTILKEAVNERNTFTKIENVGFAFLYPDKGDGSVGGFKDNKNKQLFKKLIDDAIADWTKNEDGWDKHLVKEALDYLEEVRSLFI